jgi:hypothetical protein
MLMRYAGLSGVAIQERKHGHKDRASGSMGDGCQDPSLDANTSRGLVCAIHGLTCIVHGAPPREVSLLQSVVRGTTSVNGCHSGRIAGLWCG